MAPYLISHPVFKPSFKVLSHDDEPQIPYGVTRIEFRREAEVYRRHPSAPLHWPEESQVQQGYVIARQDCFRCHNMGTEGGTMAGALVAPTGGDGECDTRRGSNASFMILRSVTPGAKMPAQPGYDDATLDALTAYFKTFTGARPGAVDHPRRDSAQ